MDSTSATHLALCQQLHDLARAEEEAAAQEAARVPYWSACPPSVHAHREAARSLRATAHRLQSAGSPALRDHPVELAG